VDGKCVRTAAKINGQPLQLFGALDAQTKRFLAPTLLVLDKLGYLPIDKTGADLLFQIISGRYEKGSTIITTNCA
jgi:DNA replication protein DnaC